MHHKTSFRPQFKVEEISAEEKAPESEEVQLEPEAFPLSQVPEPSHPQFQSQPDSFQETAEPNPLSSHRLQFRSEPRRRLPLWIIPLIIVVLLLIFGLWKLIFSRSKASEETPSPADILLESTTTGTETKTEETETKKELNRKDYQLQVLNGSGVKGVAGKMVKVLETAGFEGINAGNADNYNYDDVIIRVKEGEDDLADLIESDLEDDYKDIEIEEDLDEDSDYDAVVILGSQPGDEKVLGTSDEEAELKQATDKENGAPESTDSASEE